MKSAFFSVVAAALAAAVNAYTAPVGATPQGNPIYKPGANERVPVGKPYTITWSPTSAPNTVTLVLLRGPSTNILPMYPIVERIPNTGSYTWTPSTDLENDVTHYGIQLIDDATGFYQYTTQFGILNEGVVSSSSSSSVAATSSSAATSATPYASSSSVASSAAPYGTPSVASSVAPGYSSVPVAVQSAVPSGKGAPSIIYSTHVATVTACDCTSATAPAVPVATGPGAPAVPVVPGAPANPISAPGWNGTTPTYGAATPSGTGVSPAYNATSSSPAIPEQYIGAAAQLKAGGAMMAVVAGMAIALF